MQPIQKFAMILFMCLIFILNFGCKKKDSNPIIPPVKPEHHKVVYLLTPKEGDIWNRWTTQTISWKINKDSVGQFVYVGIQKGVNQQFEPLFTARADSLQQNLYIDMDTSSYYRLRIRGSADNWEFDTSGVFIIRENPYKILIPRAGDIYHQYSKLDVVLFGASNKNIAIDLSIDDGLTWKEIIKPNNPLTWIVNSVPSFDCLLRARDLNGKILSTSDCCFQIDDSYDPSFSITFPRSGDELHVGTKININYSKSTSKAVAFDLSTDDGIHWTEIIPLNNSAEWFINIGPLDSCKLRMRTADTSLSFVTGRFKIVSDLEEFFPLQIGKVFQYEYYNYHYYNFVTDSNFFYRYSVEIISSNVTHDSTIYTCRVSYKNLYPNKDSSTSYEFIKEYNHGLHPIASTLLPIRDVPVFRYYDKSVTEINYSYSAPDNRSGWDWNQKKGIGIIYLRYWNNGYRMHESNDWGYRLL